MDSVSNMKEVMYAIDQLLNADAKSLLTNWGMIAFVIFIMLAISVAFYFLIIMANSDSSGGQWESRASTGNDFTATKKKKRRVAVNNTRNANKTMQHSSSSNAKNCNKKKVVNSGRKAVTTSSIAVPLNVDSRPGRSSSPLASDRVVNCSVTVDDSVDDGEWITKTRNGNISTATLNSTKNVYSGESNRHKKQQQQGSKNSVATKSDCQQGPQSERELLKHAPQDKPSPPLQQVSQQPSLEQASQQRRCDKKKPMAQQQQQKKKITLSPAKTADNKKPVASSPQQATDSSGMDNKRVVEQQTELAFASPEKPVRVEADMRNAVFENEKKLKALQAEHERQLKVLQAEHYQQLKVLRDEHDERLETLRVEHQATVDQLQENVTSQRTMLEQRLRSKDRDVLMMKRHHSESEAALNAQIRDLNAKYKELLSKYKEDTGKTQEETAVQGLYNEYARLNNQCTKRQLDSEVKWTRGGDKWSVG